MGKTAVKRITLEFHPLTADRWKDFEQLFGARGACGGCWCMWGRLTSKQYEQGSGDKNKHAMKKLVSSGTEPGIIGYHDSAPVAWCAIAPRADYPRLATSRIFAPIDDKPVWSIVCLFIAKEYRRTGVSARMIKAAVAFAKSKGAKVIEGYPHDLGAKLEPDAFVWMGMMSAYEKAGFKEAARRSAKRPVVRRG
ncbi:MAG: GNAT family N-acetyltransferase [Candidatus Zixiibacteriota bacterium]|mgnify:CR=1 FL=1